MPKSPNKKPYVPFGSKIDQKPPTPKPEPMYYPQNQIQQPQRNIFVPLLQNQYNKVLDKINKFTVDKIKHWAFHREYQNYLYYTQPQQFVDFVKKQRLEHFKEYNTSLAEQFMEQAIKKRQVKVTKQLEEGKLFIEKSDLGYIVSKSLQTYPNNKDTVQVHLDQSRKKSTIFMEESKHSQPVHQKKQVYTFSEEQLKDYKQFLQRQKKQKQRIFQLKLKQAERKQQRQAKKREQEQKYKEKLRKQHSEIVAQKIKKSVELREKNKSLRQSRDKQFKYIIRSFSKGQQNLPLYEKMERSYRKRYQETFDEQRKKMHSQRLSLGKNIEELNIKSHQEKYRQWKQQNDQNRLQRFQEQEKIIEMYEQQIKKKYRNKNKIEDQDDQDQQGGMSRYQSYGHSVYIDPKDITLQKAKQRQKKMQSYWNTFVKDNKPKIDKNKREQIQKLIKQLEVKRTKRVKDQDGNWKEIELKVTDSSMVGIQYLEKAKEMGRNRKLNRKKAGIESQTQKQKDNVKNQKTIQPIDYLKQNRQARLKLTGQQDVNQKNLKFLENKTIPFTEKVDRVQRESFKLEQLTKLSQEQLKYGKFKTSEEILQYKEQIDNNHLQILRMKLKLAAQKKG